MNTYIHIPHYQQSSDGYCLPACARMVLAYLGLLYSSQNERRSLVGAAPCGRPQGAVAF